MAWCEGIAVSRNYRQRTAKSGGQAAARAVLPLPMRMPEIWFCGNRKMCRNHGRFRAELLMLLILSYI